MKETTFTFRLEGDLKQEFAALARRQDRPTAQLLRDFMRGYISKGVAPAKEDRCTAHTTEI